MKRCRAGTYRIAAPGKIFLLGEYAVREGSPALLMAVDRHVWLDRAGPRAAARRDLVQIARDRAARSLGVDAGRDRYRADSSAFTSAGTKLGLGSSAAVSVASVASVYFEAGRDIESASTRAEMWGVAKAAHDSFQHVRGSGADLAACLSGGVIAFRPVSPGRAVFVPAQLPPSIRFVFVWTKTAASTAALLRAVERFKRRDQRGYYGVVREMGLVAGRCASAAALPPPDLVASFRTYASLMDDLGRRSGVPIITEEIKQASRFADDLGGAAKPSGAGGGDIVVAAFPDHESAARFSRKVRRAGLAVLDLLAATRGVHAAGATD